MKSRHFNILFLVLAFLLSSLTHSVKAEVKAKKEEKDQAAKVYVIKAQTDALVPFSLQMDFIAPSEFVCFQIFSDNFSSAENVGYNDFRSAYLKILLTRIRPSQAP